MPAAKLLNSNSILDFLPRVLQFWQTKFAVRNNMSAGRGNIILQFGGLSTSTINVVDVVPSFLSGVLTTGVGPTSIVGKAIKGE